MTVPARRSTAENSRDAFLYLLAFSVLATWAGGLGSLWFRLIERWIPDAVTDPYPSDFRYTATWQMASILVALPIYLFVMRVILRETLLLAIGGIIFGIIVSIVARAGIGMKWPTLPVQMTWGWVLRATIIAIVGAMLGAIYPALKAAQKDPIDALAYE